ncbi:hypothetical protein B0681_09145 [Moraxella porci DSM 25326]|uniref:Cytochrome c domain-containing protein n=1 Tax=Moraxella porci DSM 25326 TaxID=573983 RepID=A0A1T0CN65_9GAMM|nr:c-type cytochrome [Moraxella porci]OOS23782.1 hypothetical protein B0681_09145 [Moraxella porci DSM 25326]
MKLINQTKQLVLPVCIAIVLSACGSEEPAATTTTQAAAPAVSSTQSTAEATQPDTASQQSPQPAEIAAKTDQAASVSQDSEVAASAAAPVEALSIEEGKRRYEATCKVCHDAGLLDAPKLSAKEEWQKRLAAKGLETLQANSAKGFNKMPAQAVGDVSEAEVYAAVNYIIQTAQ